MRTALSTIQKLHKLGRILSTTAFVISIVVLIFSIACAVLAAVGEENLVREVLSIESTANAGTLYFRLASAFLASLSEIIVAKAAVNYFKEEIKAGTPFNLKCAGKAKTLGILNIVIPVVAVILKGAAHMLLSSTFGEVGENDNALAGPIAVGLMFIVLSIICRYGSEIDNTEIDGGGK